MRAGVVAAAVLAAASHLAHERLAATPLPGAPTLEEALPSVPVLRVVALGYAPLVADYYWLRALNEFGDLRMQKARYPNLVALVRRVLALDPKYLAAYHFAGTALTVKSLDPGPSMALLEGGLKQRPDDWQIPFLLGFNRYYFGHDYAGAARALAIAARFPEAPPVTGPLAMRLAEAGGEPEVGLALVDSILAGVTDETLRADYLERRSLLVLEVELRALNGLSARFSAEHGRPPRALRDLVDAGLLPEVPVDPFGGAYGVDAAGLVHSSNDERRLRLSADDASRSGP
jgi:hypothetical protein